MGYLNDFFTFRGNNARTPEFFEDLFCNLGCYEEYRIRTSNRSIRQVRTWIISYIKMELNLLSSQIPFAHMHGIFSRKFFGFSLNISFSLVFFAIIFVFFIICLKFSGTFSNRKWCLHKLPVRLSSACEAHKTFIIAKATRVHWESSTKCG